MRLPPPPSLRATAVLACVFAAGSLRAELIKVSPFLPPQSMANATASNAPLVYSGMMFVDGVEQYRIVDPARKLGTWLKVGERDANLDVTLKQHNEGERETVTIEHGGQAMTLPLKTAKIVTTGAPVGIPGLPGNPPPNVSPAVIQTVVTNPTQADEQKRLEAVAAEVARRRALREQQAQQAAQQAQPGQQPGGAPSAPGSQPAGTRQP